MCPHTTPQASKQTRPTLHEHAANDQVAINAGGNKLWPSRPTCVVHPLTTKRATHTIAKQSEAYRRKRILIGVHVLVAVGTTTIGTGTSGGGTTAIGTIGGGVLFRVVILAIVVARTRSIDVALAMFVGVVARSRTRVALCDKKQSTRRREGKVNIRDDYSSRWPLPDAKFERKK